MLTDDEWRALSTEQKLEWLRTHIFGLIDFGNRLGVGQVDLKRRLDALEQAAGDRKSPRTEGTEDKDG